MVILIIMGLVVLGGKVWFFNMVLFSLVVDYFFVGLMWMVVVKMERLFVFVLLKVLLLRKKDDVIELLFFGF